MLGFIYIHIGVHITSQVELEDSTEKSNDDTNDRTRMEGATAKSIFSQIVQLRK